MRSPIYRWLAAALIHIALITQGCGLKPAPGVPLDVTIPQVLAAIEKYSAKVQDFSGRANVRAKVDGNYQSATVQIKFINPDRFLIYIKGFAGIDMARVSAVKDSMVIYIPSENIYVTTGTDENILGALIPEINLKMKYVASIFNGILPSREEREGFQMSIKHFGRQVELSLKRGKSMFRYRLEGQELRLISEEKIYNNVPVWRKTISAYNSIDGIEFPSEISIEHDRNIFTIKFSKCRLNSGLSDRDLSLTIPSSAERAVIEKRWQ